MLYPIKCSETDVRNLMLIVTKKDYKIIIIVNIFIKYFIPREEFIHLKCYNVISCILNC
jgi:hypothetical protein